jgi:hypothetical protein
MKKLINKPEDVVTEALQGMQALHPELIRVDEAAQIIVRAGAPVQGKVVRSIWDGGCWPACQYALGSRQTAVAGETMLLPRGRNHDAEFGGHTSRGLFPLRREGSHGLPRLFEYHAS